MNFKNYNTISADIKKQIEQVRKIWSVHLGDDLLGMYIHGSMALECFQENVSDLDILIICKQRLPREQRLLIAKDIMEADLNPCPLEMSAIWIDDLQPWKFPTRCQFHYSDYWTEQYKKLIEGEMTECSIVDCDFEDADIACYVKLTKQCGILVCGKAIDKVFPDVPEEDFWQSISCDIDDYDFNAYKPKYFASNILILGRILSYKKERRILSKYDSGLWALHYVPEQYRYIIKNALNAWYGKKEFQKCEQEDLVGLRAWLVDEIKKIVRFYEKD